MTLQRSPGWPVWCWAWVALLAFALAATQVAAVFTESVNWDELALFHRTERSASTGMLQGGGRPGLAVLLLIPFVRGCTGTIATIAQARLVWVAVTLGILAALFVLLYGAARASEHRVHAAALGVGMIALVPVFMRWSVQVRTDQPAVAAALWASVALLASRRRPWLAAVAGALFVFGYLFSQKAVYVGALGSAIALSDVIVDRPAVWARESRRIAWRVVWLAVGAALVIFAWLATMTLLYGSVAPLAPVGAVLDVFDYYRELFGYRVYVGMLPTLYPHAAALVLLLLALRVAHLRRTAQLRPLLVALAVAAMGLAVGAFHAAAFPYFWMTLGLFPACAIGLGWPAIASTWPTASRAIAVGLWAGLLIIAVPYRIEMLQDTQAVQRDTFAFIERNFDATARGFNADGGLFCRRDPQPFPVYLHEHVMRTFGGSDGDRQADLFIAEFRNRPVAFLIEDFLLYPFPRKVVEFWSTHYVRYSGAAAVAGRRLGGSAGTEIELDIIVPGHYRWSGSGSISIDGIRLDAGATITLSRGGHTATLAVDTPGGVLALALPEPPRPSEAPFHALAPVSEIAGARLVW
jgi:hypothetical protein